MAIDLEGSMELSMPGRDPVVLPMELEGKIEIATVELDEGVRP